MDVEANCNIKRGLRRHSSSRFLRQSTSSVKHLPGCSLPNVNHTSTTRPIDVFAPLTRKYRNQRAHQFFPNHDIALTPFRLYNDVRHHYGQSQITTKDIKATMGTNFPSTPDRGPPCVDGAIMAQIPRQRHQTSFNVLQLAQTPLPHLIKRRYPPLPFHHQTLLSPSSQLQQHTFLVLFTELALARSFRESQGGG